MSRVEIHTREMKLSQKLLQSTYRIGLAYEKLTVGVLKQYSFHLKHTGGTGDGGQDFTGYWKLSDRSIPVVGEHSAGSYPITGIQSLSLELGHRTSLVFIKSQTV